MELWVRSQNKKFLSKVKCFEILEDPNNKNGIGIWNEIDHLGWYKNEKRALEVLDEIQEILEQVNDTNLTILPILVYEMPKE